MILYRKLALVLALAASLVLIGGTSVAAQSQQAPNNVGTLLAGLVNVNVSDVAVDVETGDITVVNVEDSLNENDIRVLNNVLNNNEVASRNRDVLND